MGRLQQVLAPLFADVALEQALNVGAIPVFFGGRGRGDLMRDAA